MVISGKEGGGFVLRASSFSARGLFRGPLALLLLVEPRNIIPQGPVLPVACAVLDSCAVES